MGTVDWEAFRRHFPAAERYTYLNTASGGILSAGAACEARRYYDEAHAEGDARWTDWLERAATVRGEVAAFLNAASDEVAFLANASLGLNLAAQLFDDDGEVLTTTDEFPSDTLPWLRQAHPVRFLPTAPDGYVAPADFAGAVGPRTRYLVTSSVQYRTGFRHDLAALGRLCRAHDLVFVVDATQGVAAFPLDVERQHIDVLVFSGYKWATAGYGIAVLYMRRTLLAGRVLPMVGWRSARDPYALRNDRLDLAGNTTALELGHPLFPGIFALGGALRLFREVGAAAVEARVRDLTAYLHRRLDEAGVPIGSTRDPAHRSGITMLCVPDAGGLAARLEAEGILVAARGGRLRVAVHCYNNPDDVDRLVAALERLLPCPAGNPAGNPAGEVPYPADEARPR